MPSSKHSSEKYDCGKRKNKSLAKAEKEAGQPRNCETEVLEDDCGCDVSFKRMEKFLTAG